MILVSGTAKIRPERRHEVIQLAVWMQTQTQSEPGCMQYRFYADLEHPDTILVFEQWENDEALRLHFQPRT